LHVLPGGLLLLLLLLLACPADLLAQLSGWDKWQQQLLLPLAGRAAGLGGTAC